MNPAPSTIFYRIYPLQIEEVKNSVLVLSTTIQNLLNNKEGAG
jgi:hypothetical protein